MQNATATAVVRRRRTATLPDGTTIELEQLTFKDFAQIREEACAQYKRAMIQTWTKNLDLLPENMRQDAVQRAFDRAEKITPDAMPKKKAWVPTRDREGRVVRNVGEAFYHEEAQELIGLGDPLPKLADIEYSGWWMSQDNLGKLYATWLSMRKCPGQEKLTLDEVDQMFMNQLEALDSAANVVGDLSAPRLGNEDAPAAQQVGAK